MKLAHLAVPRRALASLAVLALNLRPPPSAIAAEGQKRLQFTETDSGLRYADIRVGSGDAVETGSRVTFNVIGRLVGRQGWLFENSQVDGEDPYRLVVGQGGAQ